MDQPGVIFVRFLFATLALANWTALTEAQFTEPIPQCPISHPCECLGNRIKCDNKNLLGIPEISASTYEWYELHLEVNRIRVLSAGAFNGLTVKKIYLQMNSIERIDPDAFRGLKGVILLEMGYNKITSIPGRLLAPLTDLTSLNLPNNKIRSLPANTFEYNTQLGHLQLNNNELREVPVKAFRHLMRLRRLYLQNNEFTEFPEYAFANLPLQILHLENNKAPVKISPKTFCGLNPRPIGGKEGALTKNGVVGLFRLSLQNNGIRSLHPCALFDVWTLASLNLKGNQLHCGCDLLFTSHRSSRGQRKLQLEHSQCTTPDNLRGRDVTNVSVSEIASCDFNAIQERCAKDRICYPAYRVKPSSANSIFINMLLILSLLCVNLIVYD